MRWRYFYAKAWDAFFVEDETRTVCAPEREADARLIAAAPLLESELRKLMAKAAAALAMIPSNVDASALIEALGTANVALAQATGVPFDYAKGK